MKTARIRSLAKVNLDLRILNKRQDGFHNLRTVFQTISLADTISIEYRPARRTTIAIEGNVTIPGNLIVQAAEAVLNATRTAASVRFVLNKQVPMGGGLGGGSSNAAAVLLALPVLSGKSLDFEDLLKIGTSLGSDVPFFLQGGTAVALDRGTEFYSLPDISEQEILVVSAGVHVATGPAYAALGRGLTFTGSSTKINGFQEFVRSLSGGRRADLASALSENDFEKVVFRQYPKLKKILAELSKFGPARMTGSGSAMFAIYPGRAERERARKALEREKLFEGSSLMPAKLVSRRSYERLWRRQLREHIDPDEDLWPPRSRYAR